jgi:SAM-dependent methyltransferase
MWSRNSDLESKALALPDELRVKFHELPGHLHDWLAPFGGLEGKRVLDFGCGSGFSAAGIALLGGTDLVVGVDINPESRHCRSFLRSEFGLDDLPDNLRFEEIRPGQTTSFDGLDCVFSWSVFEHVDERIFAGVVSAIVEKMRPGGLFFVQIAPLYFSPEGGHLWAIGYKAWEHLLNQTANVEADIRSASHLSDEEKSALVGMFKTLNRITADDLIERFTAAGLTLLREQRDKTKLQPPPSLARAYAQDALSTHQIVALFRKPD